MSKKVIFIIGCFSFIFFANSKITHAKDYVFSLIGFPKAVFNKPVHEWRDRVLKETKGRVNFKYPPKPLAPPPRLFDATLSGITDGALQFNSFLIKRVPSIQVGQLPLTFTRADAHGVALWRTYQKFFAQKKEFAPVKLAGFYAGPGGYMCSLIDKPITSVASLQKMKTWSLPGYAAKALQLLKVNVVPGPAVRIYPIVSKGIVDGYSSLVPHNAYDFNIIRYTKSCTEIPGGLTASTFSIVINPKVWAGFSAEDKSAIDRASGEKIAWSASFWRNHHLKMNKKFQEDGKKIIKASPKFVAALQKAWRPLHQGWIKSANKAGFDGQAAFDYFLAENKRVASKANN